VVVFDYEVKFQPAEGPGRFEGRETYPTGYGVEKLWISSLPSTRPE
jgi:hypothetical protein